MNTMTVKEAADYLGCSVAFVRGGLQQGTLPIGSAVKFKRWAYHINREAVERYKKGQADEKHA